MKIDHLTQIVANKTALNGLLAKSHPASKAFAPLRTETKSAFLCLSASATRWLDSVQLGLKSFFQGWSYSVLSRFAICQFYLISKFSPCFWYLNMQGEFSKLNRFTDYRKS